jgi:hypothetical protein
VDLQQRFALAFRSLVLGRFRRIRHGNPEPPGKQPDRLRECHLVEQLDELEHVAADAAAEAVEKPLVRIDVE